MLTEMKEELIIKMKVAMLLRGVNGKYVASGPFIGNLLTPQSAIAYYERIEAPSSTQKKVQPFG